MSINEVDIKGMSWINYVTRQPVTGQVGLSSSFKNAIDAAIKVKDKQHEPLSAVVIADVLRVHLVNSALNSEEDSVAQGNRSVMRLNDLLKNTYGENTVTDTEFAKETANEVTKSNFARSERAISIDSIIEKASEKYGVDKGLIKAVIKVESNFNADAVSTAGAQGLMQLMPATAKGLGVSNPFDPVQNIMAGTRFLKDMLKKYNGNLDSALAAYNWGPGNFDRKRTLLPRETKEYLVRVKEYYNQYAG
jgi:soluble lytic murein transglycosylase-like protein